MIMGRKYKMLLQEKIDYLKQEWGFVCVEIRRSIGNVPLFDDRGYQIPMVNKKPCGLYYFCKNYEIDNQGNIFRRYGFLKKSFYGERKDFPGSSVEEAVDFAYRNERIGKQLDLFVRGK